MGSDEDRVSSEEEEPVSPLLLEECRLHRVPRLMTKRMHTDSHLVMDTLSRFKRPRELDSATLELISEGIKKSHWCRRLDAHGVEAIGRAMEYYEFVENEVVVRQGDPGQHFFVVQQGALEVLVNDNSVNTLGVGSAFGDMALLFNCPRSATVVARELVGVWGADGDVFRNVMKEHAEKSYAENRRFLDSIRLFDGLSAMQKERVGELALMTEEVEAGHRVFTEGEEPVAIYCVKRGELSVLAGATVDASGVATGGTKLAQLQTGDVFGETAVLFGEPHRATVVAEGPCEIVCVGVKQLQEVVGQDLPLCLHRSFVISVFRQLPVLSHLSQTQQHKVVEVVATKCYEPDTAIGEGLLFIAVVDGEVTGIQGGNSITLRRGQWCEDDGIFRTGLDTTDDASPSGSAIGLTGFVAGASGCTLAVLSCEELTKSLRELGYTNLGGAEQTIDYIKRTLLAKKVPIFLELSADQVDSISSLFVVKRFSRGATIIQEGEVGNAVYVVASGELSVTVNGDKTRTLSKGSCFGERALLLDEPRSATVEVASEEAELWSVDRHTFNEVVTEQLREELTQRMLLQDTSVTLKSLVHVRVLGAGSFGTVRLVQHRRTQQKYALKRVHKVDGAVPDDVKRECDLLAEMDHPFMLRMVRTFETAASIYILTELITGGSLYEQMHRMGVLSRKQAQFYGASLILMLEHLHERNIIYRDLKPENVMLDSKGYLKLIDFGLCKRLEAGNSRTFSLVGTLLYMAPEVLRGQGYGTEADIWSFGMLFYELVCGRLPFPEGLSAEEEVITAILEEDISFPDRYSDQAGRRLISGLLNKQPEQRLGAGVDRWEEVKSSKYFKAGTAGSLFNKIVSRELPPPCIPEGEQYVDEAELQRISLSDAEELGGPEDADEGAGE